MSTCVNEFYLLFDPDCLLVTICKIQCVTFKYWFIFFSSALSGKTLESTLSLKDGPFLNLSSVSHVEKSIYILDEDI